MLEFEGRIYQMCCISHASNLGLDLNYQAVALAASGEFAWVMGAHDRIELNGMNKVFQLLDDWPDVVGLTLGILDYVRVPGTRDCMPNAGALMVSRSLQVRDDDAASANPLR